MTQEPTSRAARPTSMEPTCEYTTFSVHVTVITPETTSCLVWMISGDQCTALVAQLSKQIGDGFPIVGPTTELMGAAESVAHLVITGE